MYNILQPQTLQTIPTNIHFFADLIQFHNHNFKYLIYPNDMKICINSPDLSPESQTDNQMPTDINFCIFNKDLKFNMYKIKLLIFFLKHAASPKSLPNMLMKISSFQLLRSKTLGLFSHLTSNPSANPVISTFKIKSGSNHFSLVQLDSNLHHLLLGSLPSC